MKGTKTVDLEGFLQELIDIILRNVESQKKQTIIFQEVLEHLRDVPKEAEMEEAIDSMTGYCETFDAAWTRVYEG